MTTELKTDTGTTSQPVQSTWEVEAYQRVLALKDLPNDWVRRRDHRKPTTEAINGALRYIGHVEELNLPMLSAPFIAPLYEGGVQLEWDHGSRHIELEILPDGAAKFTVQLGNAFKYGDFGPTPQSVLRAIFGWLTATP